MLPATRSRYIRFFRVAGKIVPGGRLAVWLPGNVVAPWTVAVKVTKARATLEPVAASVIAYRFLLNSFGVVAIFLRIRQQKQILVGLGRSIRDRLGHRVRLCPYDVASQIP